MKAFDEGKRQIVVDLRKAGMTYQEIANEIGHNTTSWVGKVCTENGLGGTYAKEVKYAEYRKYKAEGHTILEVAEHFDISRCNAQIACRGIAKQPCRNQHYKKTEDEKREYVERLLPFGFSYDSGYIDCDHHVNLRCNVCNAVFDASMISIRKGNQIACSNCKRIEKEEEKNKKQKEQEQKQFDREQKKLQRQRDLEAERFSKTRLVQCVECGKVFSTLLPKQVCCSTECSKRYYNHISTRRKDHRIAKDKRIDKDITVKKLYERDNGICWICGSKCDISDYCVRDSVVICGDNYPSIDHIVPVCDGGEDAWDNVRLAHRKCNVMRYWQDFHAPRVDTA